MNDRRLPASVADAIEHVEREPAQHMGQNVADTLRRLTGRARQAAQARLVFEDQIDDVGRVAATRERRRGLRSTHVEEQPAPSRTSNVCEGWQSLPSERDDCHSLGADANISAYRC